MRVFEAAGSGLENFQLVQNAMGLMAANVSNNSATIANAINMSTAIGTASSASGQYVVSWPASRFGSVAPFLLVQCAQVATLSQIIPNIVGIASNNATIQFNQLNGATNGAATRIVANNVTFTVLAMAVSATGTGFTSASGNGVV